MKNLETEAWRNDCAQTISQNLCDLKGKGFFYIYELTAIAEIMVTCFLKYVIDPAGVAAFEYYGKLWIDIVNEMGGLHHGYLLPHEGANNIGYASFSFPSLAAYETYRAQIQHSTKCLEAFKYAEDTKCIISYERNFLKPVFEGFTDKAKLFY